MPDETQSSDSAPDRRRLTIAAILGFMGALCAFLGLPSMAYLFSRPKTQSRQQWVDLGNIDEFAPGAPRPVTYSHRRRDGWVVEIVKERAWVVTAPNGSVTAFSPWCTHLGCAYDWDGALREFTCPCHGSRFGIDGQRTAGPALRGLDRYEVRRAGSRVWLNPVAVQEASRS